MSVMQGPVVDHRVHELLSIAKSIEGTFPTSAETLRAIANTLKEATPIVEPLTPVWSAEEVDGEIKLVPMASEELGRLLAPGSETIYFFQEN